MIYIGSDHAGYAQKQKVIEYLKKNDIEYIDVGPFNEERTDYPIYAKLVCENIKDEQDKGILVCGSGIGMSICANRYSHIRACLAVNKKMAYLGRHHNNANVLVLQGRNKCTCTNIKITKTFLNETFDGGRHIDRINMLSFTK
ncbi:MAG: ribose 5-phosphate isomerase B [Clostridia bacterium]|nr:ribose 5-phosphate isomerase B [Clostridia bacterium]